MRSINALTILGATTIALTFTTAADAQADGANNNSNQSGGLSLSFGGSSNSSGTTEDSGVNEEQNQEEAKPKNEKLPWRGTSLTLDQAFTTQTVGIGSDYISNNPTYEMALILRPRYYLLDGDSHSIYAGIRLDLSREFTNSDYTLDNQETRFGNIPLDIVYGAKLYAEGATTTSLRVSGRFVFPTDRYTYRGGTRLRLGGGLGLTQTFPLAGTSSSWFPAGSIGGTIAYLKHINASTTSTNNNAKRERQDVNGNTFFSNQFGSGAKVSHELTPGVSASVGVTDSVNLALSYTWILQWKYKFDDEVVQITSGPVTPDRNDPQSFRVIPFVMAALDYALIPEVGLGVGYLNQANQIGPEGTRRNPLWSPGASFFIDITANLDEIYTTASGNRAEKAASHANIRQQARATSLGNSW
ncbi:MAG: hypothetical protein FWD57_10140 [Polyangiaceae bacterium]|nr:hypothetical protein [Polyangiaceae bacterium]